MFNQNHIEDRHPADADEIDQRIESALDRFISAGKFGRVEDPYQVARQTADSIQTARNGQNKFLQVLTAGALALAAFSVYRAQEVAAMGNYRAAIVERDKLGRTEFAQWAEQRVEDIDPLIVREKLREFVEKWRSVSADGATNKKNAQAVSAMVARGKGNPARTIMTEWYRDNSPGERAKNEIVSVDVSRIVVLPDTNTWVLDWTETTRTTTGELKYKPRRWNVTLTIGWQAAENEQEFILNPLRVMVRDLKWTRQG